MGDATAHSGCPSGPRVRERRADLGCAGKDLEGHAKEAGLHHVAG